jgi:hypothetical protein
VMNWVLCWKLATVDPARTLRVIDGWPNIDSTPDFYFYLAVGARARDESISRQAFRTALPGLDRMMEARPERFVSVGSQLLALAEHIDPALVPEIFWRYVAARLPYGNPRARNPDLTVRITELAWYDREVAAVLFEPIRTRMAQTQPTELATWGFEFLTWSLIDPRAAVARLETIPVAEDTSGRDRSYAARLAVGASLARSRDERWRASESEREYIFGGKRSF